MKITKIYSSKHFVIPRDNSVLIVKLTGYISTEDTHIIIHAIKDATVKNHLQKMILNQRELKIIPKESEALLASSGQLFHKAGLAQVASVEPENVFGKMSVEKLKAADNTPGNYASFQTQADAMKWLAE